MRRRVRLAGAGFTFGGIECDLPTAATLELFGNVGRDHDTRNVERFKRQPVVRVRHAKRLLVVVGHHARASTRRDGHARLLSEGRAAPLDVRNAPLNLVRIFEVDVCGDGIRIHQRPRHLSDGAVRGVSCDGADLSARL